ncbi:hypothetical protein [Neolewinella persica]|uniref:hypothetical protein n=1 Tax=Neolewinella persica TaxID=70998 RepID=UPI00037CB276|nr:hypothetical protein [Neolewinella persica]
MKNHLDFSDAEFSSEFESCRLPPELFTHEAHLRLGWIHLKEQGGEAAVEIVRKQIANYVVHLGASDKFNVTLTVAAVKTVQHFWQKSTSDNFVDFMLEFPRLKYNFKELISAHYGFDIYNSQRAKKAFLAPDLLPYD